MSRRFMLEVLTDIDMLRIFAKIIHGGITRAVKRYPKANNNCMKERYYPNEKSTFL